MSKNIIIKQYNGSGYDELYPKTDANLVENLSTSVQNIVSSGGYCKVEYGSYTGTGTFGRGNPNSITFSFVPKFIILMSLYNGTPAYRSESYVYWTIDTQFLTTDTYTRDIGFALYNSPYGKTSIDKKTIYWYFDGSVAEGEARYQCNLLGVIYPYMALG